MKSSILKCSALCVLVATIFTILPLAHGGDTVYDTVFRLHIIANSDSYEDQAIKLMVRDALLAYEEETMEKAQNKEEAKALLMSNGAEILTLVERVLSQNGMDYGAQLMIGEFAFPNREYDGQMYPAGVYQALRIVLGSGRGNNWWCVMFPPLCILELDDGKIEKGKLRFESLTLKLLQRIDGGNLWKRLKGK